MRRASFLVLIAVLAGPASARVAIGQYGRWGAFREPPATCFAAAEPVNDAGEGGPFIAITLTRGPPRLHVVPSRATDRPLRLDIGDRAFVLTGDVRQDARIIGAIRQADRLRVTGVDARGRHFHDDYALAGAPSAIDAAIVACLSDRR